MEIEIEVDHELCYGAQNCLRVVPGVFRYDEEGKAVPVDPKKATREQLAAAVDGCPAGAIAVVDKAGG